MTKAERAVRSMIRRIKEDPRVAYLIGPYSDTYDQLTDAYAEMISKDPDEFRAEFEAGLKCQRLPPIEEAQ